MLRPSLRQAAVLAWALTRALPCCAAAADFVATDPLTRQIQRRQMTLPNGGVTAWVRVASGQSVPLKIVELDLPALNAAGEPNLNGLGGLSALGGLSVEPGLAAPHARSTAPSAGRPIKPAADQLKHLDKQGVKQGWGEGRRR